MSSWLAVHLTSAENSHLGEWKFFVREARGSYEFLLIADTVLWAPLWLYRWSESFVLNQLHTRIYPVEVNWDRFSAKSQFGYNLSQFFTECHKNQVIPRQMAKLATLWFRRDLHIKECFCFKLSRKKPRSLSWSIKGTQWRTRYKERFFVEAVKNRITFQMGCFIILFFYDTLRIAVGFAASFLNAYFGLSTYHFLKCKLAKVIVANWYYLLCCQFFNRTFSSFTVPPFHLSHFHLPAFVTVS